MLKFGDFGYLCAQSSLSYCSSLRHPEPKCYSRNIDFNGFLLFQPAVFIMGIAALVMTFMMIYNIKKKYTAIGRKEMVLFFYLYSIDIILDILLSCNFIPIGSTLYNYFCAAQIGFITATFWILLLNGILGFQWTEDGTKCSLWSLRLSSAIVFAIGITISCITFNTWFGIRSQLYLFILFQIFNATAFLIYVVLQFILVLKTHQDRWPLGDLLFGVLFFVTGQLILWFGSQPICRLTVHYADGLFLTSLCNLLAVMMVYKYWDSITKEDWEFSVQHNPSYTIKGGGGSKSGELFSVVNNKYM